MSASPAQAFSAPASLATSSATSLAWAQAIRTYRWIGFPTYAPGRAADQRRSEGLPELPRQAIERVGDHELELAAGRTGQLATAFDRDLRV
jgi:hypothetical protein